MNKAALLIINLLFFSSSSLFSIQSFGQKDSLLENNLVKKIDNQLFTISLLTPGISFEQRVMNAASVRLYTQLNPLIRFSSTDNSLDWAQTLGLQFRYYYNLKDRQILGRNVRKNSLNYLVISPSVSIPYIPHKNVAFSLEAEWGIQRSYNNWLFDFEFGVATYLNNNVSKETIYPIANVSLGYILFKNLYK